MMNTDQSRKDFIWVEKFRPQTIDDCILPERIKTKFRSYVSSNSMPNLLLTGTAGTGKTTIARALCDQLDYDYIIINASKERGIDNIRNKIINFCGTVSLMGQKKAIILDEADGLTSEAQDALRAAMEEFHFVRFILTCNFRGKLKAPIQSRTTCIEFNILKEEKLPLMTLFLKRTFDILKDENIVFDQNAVSAIIKKHFPDNRRILNELQGAATTGNITMDIVNSRSCNVADLVTALKAKDFGGARNWVANNSDIEPTALFKTLYDALYLEVEPDFVPQLAIWFSEYEYRSAFVANQEINTTALLSQIMGAVNFK